MKRLFLFALYDPQGIVGEAVLRYLEALHACGDIVLAADCDLLPGEPDKFAPLVKAWTAVRHGEYDFGSYKRAYALADVAGYDWVYLVNDSVVGPLYPLEPYLVRLEALRTDATALVLNPSPKGRHLQSWFIGLKWTVAATDWLGDFLSSVTVAGSKEEVCLRYENGLTRLLEAHSVSYAGLYVLRGKAVYNRVWHLFKRGFPFLKKSAFTRHGGSLGFALRRILDAADPAMARSVVADMDRTLGETYRRTFLSAGPLRACARYFRYLLRKLR